MIARTRGMGCHETGNRLMGFVDEDFISLRHALLDCLMYGLPRTQLSGKPDSSPRGGQCPLSSTMTASNSQTVRGCIAASSSTAPCASTQLSFDTCMLMQTTVACH